jgi:hypothetical protein
MCALFFPVLVDGLRPLENTLVLGTAVPVPPTCCGLEAALFAFKVVCGEATRVAAGDENTAFA